MTFPEKYEEFIAGLMDPGSWIWEDWQTDAVPQLFWSGGLKEPSEGYQKELSKALLEKRDFGLKKYGEKSFQGSEENVREVDVIQHAKEELIDYLNYTLHRMYQAATDANINELVYCRKRFQLAVTLLYMTR